MALGLFIPQASADILLSDSFNPASGTTFPAGLNTDLADRQAGSESMVTFTTTAAAGERAELVSPGKLEIEAVAGTGALAHVSADLNLSSALLSAGDSLVISYSVDPTTSGINSASGSAALYLGLDNSLRTNAGLGLTNGFIALAVVVDDDGEVRIYEDGGAPSATGNIAGTPLEPYDVVVTIALPNGVATGAAATASVTVDGTLITTSPIDFEFNYNDNYFSLVRQGVGTASFDDLSVTVVPEPGAMALIFAGAGLMVFRRR